MPVYFQQTPLQLLLILFFLSFLWISIKKPVFVFRIIPIVLPFYLIKIYFYPVIIFQKLNNLDFKALLNSFFTPPYQEYPVFVPDFGEQKIQAIPTNLLELCLVFFLIFNFKLIIRGLKILKKNSLGSYFLYASLSFLFFSFASTLFGINQRVSLGIFKSWFFLPFLIFLVFLPYLAKKNFQKKHFSSLLLSGFVILILVLPFIFQKILTYDGRLSAIFLSPNHLGMLLAPGFLIFFLELWKKKILKNYYTDPILFSIAIIGLTIYSIVLYLTFSYSTWIGLSGSLFVFLFFYKKKHSLFLFLITFLIFFSQISNPKLKSILEGEYYSSFHSRQMIWQSALFISRDHFWLGVGPGNFQEAYLDYAKSFKEPYLEWAAPEPHNLFLAFQTQIGFLGTLSFVLMIFLSILQLKKLLQKKEKDSLPSSSVSDSIQEKLLLSSSLFLLYLIIHGLVDTPYFKNDLALLFWIFLAPLWLKNKPRGNP